MPYPFAHPAAILPLVRPMRALAVPSALAIGSMAPDAWYLFPGLVREASHSVQGLFLFCVPVGLLAYCLFHLLLKQPLLALLPAPLAARLAGKRPRAGWLALIASLLAGASTHLLWDAATHERFVVGGFQLLQHASTFAGTAILLAWVVHWYRRTPPSPVETTLSPGVRWSAVAVLIGLSAGIAAAGLSAVPANVEELRFALRSAAMAGGQALALSLIGYALIFRLLR